MLSVTSFPNDHFGSCAYVVSCEGSAQAMVIDPADAASGGVEAFLAERGFGEVVIALTHEHFDHISGVSRLRQIAGARLICSACCSESIAQPTKNFSRYLIGRDVTCSPADLLYEDLDQRLEWCGAPFEFIPTPGHSPGGVCIAAPGILFTGDTLIHNLQTVTKLPGGNRGELVRSVDTIMTRFPGETVVYPGHGAPFTLGQVDRNVIIGRLRV